MLAHYSHVRLQAKRTALDSLSTKRAERDNLGCDPGGYDTKHDTKRNTMGLSRVKMNAALDSPASHHRTSMLTSENKLRRAATSALTFMTFS